MKKFNKNVSIDIKALLFSNLKVKLLCFLFAVAMYFFIGFFQRSTKIYSTKLQIENLKDYYVISNQIQDTVKITVNAERSVFDKITEEDFNVRIDLSEIKEPSDIPEPVKVTWDVPKSMKSFFSTIKVEPNHINIKIEKLAEKNVRVNAIRFGDPAPGYIVKRSTITPSTIRIQGPKSIIDEITSINTEVINIEGVKESFGRQVNLVPEYQTVKALGKVNVFFEVIEETDILTYKYSRIFFQNLKKQYKANIKNQIEVKLEGPKNFISNIAKEDITVYVDCSGLVYPGDYQLPVKVNKPEKLKIVSILPERVVVTISDR